MGMKRKHTDDASPTSLSSFGAFSTPEAHSSSPYPQLDGTMDMELDTAPRTIGWDFTRAHRVKSNDWGNRTRKRVRDNRPDERSIHVHKLFAAQRAHPHASPIPSDLAPSNQPAITISKTQKSTLHAFWNLPAPPLQTPIFSYHTAQQNQESGPRCEDCDARLEHDEAGMDVDMNLDGTFVGRVLSCRRRGTAYNARRAGHGGEVYH
ncbi:hypothetical protein N0V94_006856 [Neodidymelliopsis sp. IMI 364377]|nr:hypothetical protein N0V94_006856 [Neodidymelliopsis sp. IMI 364377]